MCGMHKLMDDLSLAKADLEAQQESLKEEQLSLKTNHEQVQPWCSDSYGSGGVGGAGQVREHPEPRLRVEPGSAGIRMKGIQMVWKVAALACELGEYEGTFATGPWTSWL